MSKYAPGEVKYKLATLNNEVGEMALTYIREIEQDNSLLRGQNQRLKTDYQDSLVACGILKEKIDLMTKPSPIEAMQDTLVTTLKAQNEKLKEQVEKMKCCTNCKYWLYASSCKSHTCVKDGEKGEYYRSCIQFEKWELVG